jgi:hypothetical protein
MLIDLLFTLGQTASALLLLYGAYLVILPARPVMDEAALLQRHLQHE